MPLHETNEIVNEVEEKELLYEVRVDLAFNKWKEAQGALSLRKAAKQYSIAYTTLQNRSKGAVSRKEAQQINQRLSVQKEEAIHKWVLQLGAWGWPPLISQLYRIASDLLKPKGDFKPLGVNWPSHFLTRHPECLFLGV